VEVNPCEDLHPADQGDDPVDGSAVRRLTCPRQVSREKVLALLEDASRIARKAPRRAGAMVAGIIEPVTRPAVIEGHRGDVTLSNDSAAPKGGRVCVGDGWGGARI